LNKAMVCATCHDPDHGFVDARFIEEGDANPVYGALSVGDDGLTLGRRNAPKAACALFSSAFHFDEIRGEYVGGQFHDGRAVNLKVQDVNATINRVDLAMPAPSEEKIDALVAFLKTLTDRRYEHLVK
jgi:cytochrome c peroxidase